MKLKQLYLLLFAICLASFSISCKRAKTTHSVSKYSNKNGKELETDELIQKAKKHIGTKYRLGGKEPNQGFDCSGFTCYMFAKFNITLPPTAILQAETGWAVSANEADKGDLIFFKGENASSSKIGHVGIIVSDKGKYPIEFIHASSSKGIMISSLKESYFQKRFVKIRRVRS
ncbi:MAG: C40 family peptidase [Bacteroidota bacterium]|nr:C40 family peptidase [Bacteroidota bacterium]